MPVSPAPAREARKVDATTAESLSEWLWAVSFADDDDRELTSAEVEAAILGGQVSAETIAWREGLPDWLPLGEIDAFRPAFAKRFATAAADTHPAHPVPPREPSNPVASKAESPAPTPLAEEDGITVIAPSVPPPEAPVWTSTMPPATPEEEGGVDSGPPNSQVTTLRNAAREDWRRSTADLLAELAGDAPSPPVALPAAAIPVPAGPASPPPLPRPPPPPRVPIFSSFPPPKSKARIVAYVVVAVIVVGMLAGLALLIAKVLATPDDPTLGGTPSPVARPSAEGAAASSVMPSASPSATAAPRAAGSGAADLAQMIQQNVDRSSEVAGTPFDERTARAALAEAVQRAALCRKKGDEKGPAKVAVTFDPATGRPSDVRLIGRYAGTQSGSCIETTLRAIRTKKFSGEPVTIEDSVLLR
ncbi:MAG: DUF4339 domain-containing protein [Polyangiaceae bacterium]|nr:DUF4339 domain-containing protein [Polyangiaceae bacterium]